jgi:hypothetical protein
VAPDDAVVAHAGTIGAGADSLLAPRTNYAPGAPVSWSDEGWGRGASAWVQPIESGAATPSVEPTGGPTERIRVTRAPRT